MSAVQMNADERIAAHPLFLGLTQLIDDRQADALAGMIADSLGLNPTQVIIAARAARPDTDASVRAVQGEILGEEFQAFKAAAVDAADEANFKTRAGRFEISSSDHVERELANLFESVVLVDRLREVRAALGFKRYRPDADLVPAVAVSSGEASWLPASEGFGEGIFLRLKADTVDAWAMWPEVKRRASELSEKFDESRFSLRLHPFSAEYVAVHSLAHALLREFAFTSGYSAASLRERVYCESPGEYGVFIYTTSSDEEGTLGGLVREGESDRIGSALARAAEQLSWCSNDPVCSESHPQNLDGLNLAACHSCLLASETSCEGANLLLDRVLLIGSDSMPGLLSGVISALALTG